MTDRGGGSHPYDNSRGSALLALCRAGMLMTRTRRQVSDPDIDTTCTRCGMVPETMEHVIFECNEVYFGEEDLTARLGFGKNPPGSRVKTTKRLLEYWEKETRQTR